MIKQHPFCKSPVAGLRRPSEIGALTWGDINWEKGRLTVLAKTTGPRLEAAQKQAALAMEGSAAVKWRGQGVNKPRFLRRN